jgi:hypothetical protein
MICRKDSFEGGPQHSVLGKLPTLKKLRIPYKANAQFVRRGGGKRWSEAQTFKLPIHQNHAALAASAPNCG